MPTRKGSPLTARVHLTVDDEVVFDDTLDTWVFTPPDYFRNAIKPDAKPEPWLKAINGLYDRQAADLEAQLMKKFGSEVLSFKTPLKIIGQY